MKIDLYIKVYHKKYPEVKDEVLEIDEMIECDSFIDAKVRLKAIMSVLTAFIYPDNPSTSYVGIPGGQKWTYTDVK